MSVPSGCITTIVYTKVNLTVSIPLWDVTDRMSIIYACNAAHLRRRRRRGWRRKMRRRRGVLMSLTCIEN